ncbi:hypothetical protein BD779DRAFT_1642013 [Infundibulicybe gibba]|nr:hypothetical protein BD779DRAFT_1642013 [Infundibulicybe gibba]
MPKSWKDATGDANVPIKYIGTPAFMQAVIALVRDLSLIPLPLDPVIIQYLLLCMVVGDKHLIIHTPDEDVSNVVRLVTWTLSTVFDYPTHRWKVRPHANGSQRAGVTSSPEPATFLRSLFFAPIPARFDDEHSSATAIHVKRRRKSVNHLRPGSRSSGLKVWPQRDQLGHTTSDTAGEPSVEARLRNQKPPSLLPHAHTDPLPTRPSASDMTATLELPHAVVVSGLEHASMTSQRALAQALSERRVVLDDQDAEQPGATLGRPPMSSRSSRHSRHVGRNIPTEYEGVWNLPQDFIMVYICPWNAKERPPIQHSLLDKFAMSTTYFMQPKTWDVFRSLPFMSTSNHTHQSYSHSNPSSPSPQAAQLPQSRTPPTLSQSLPALRALDPRPPVLSPRPCIPRALIISLQSAFKRTYLSPNLSFYLSDLFSAARHHPQLDGALLTAKSMKDAEDLARAARVLGVNPTGTELVREFTERNDMYQEFPDGNDSSYEIIADDVASGSVTIQVSHDWRHHSIDDRSLPQEGAMTPTLDMSEADVARIVPRVVSHRLRVRSGPEDEILGSAIFGANSKRLDPEEEKPNYADVTVKESLSRFYLTSEGRYSSVGH